MRPQFTSWSVFVVASTCYLRTPHPMDSLTPEQFFAILGYRSALSTTAWSKNFGSLPTSMSGNGGLDLGQSLSMRVSTCRSDVAISRYQVARYSVRCRNLVPTQTAASASVLALQFHGSYDTELGQFKIGNVQFARLKYRLYDFLWLLLDFAV